MAKRSSSSMAVLGLLSIDRWTPYELVQHMKRSTIHYIWPRAESKMYEEPKRLATAGFAKASADRKDPRRTNYSITAAGRRVLAAWVAEPGAGVRFESEGALKVLLAEHGTKEQLLATIDSIRRDALDDMEQRRPVLEAFLTEGPPYPDRIHQSSLIVDLINRLATAVVEWADVTEERVREWPAVAPDQRMRDEGMNLMRDICERASATVDKHASRTPPPNVAAGVSPPSP